MADNDTDGAAIYESLDNPGLFAAVFERHFDAIYAYMRRRVGSQLAEDLAAEAFVQAFRARSTYDTSRSDARPWLYGIATNLLRHHHREEGRRWRAYGRSPIGTVTTEDMDAAESRLDAMMLAPTIATALASLQDGDRDALLLAAWAQLSYVEIADALGIPVGTVRSRLHRAKAQVRELVGEIGQKQHGEHATPHNRVRDSHG